MIGYASRAFEIAGRRVGPDYPLFVIAEIGLNHDGDADQALKLVDEAARAGAQAVKLQSLRADRLVAAHCPAPTHVDASSLRDLFVRYELDAAAHARIARRARAHGMAFMSTPFDEGAVELLEDLECDAVKIASGDITHLPLIARAARTGRPLIISTGLSTLHDVQVAVSCARDAGAAAVALLHCVSAYPVVAEQQNLGAIRTLAGTFGLPVGLSDHSADAADVPMAIALGACIYERHIRCADGGDVIDAAVSSTGAQLADVAAAAGRARQVLGHGRREPQPAELPNKAASRRALYATRALAPGDVIRAEDIVALRPADGLAPGYFDRLVGLPATRPIARGGVFTDGDLCVQEEGAARGVA
jgi:sialic acid synthase SpsE